VELGFGVKFKGIGKREQGIANRDKGLRIRLVSGQSGNWELSKGKYSG
jgi:hypothetical protein